MDSNGAQQVKFNCLGVEIAAQIWGADGLPRIIALHGWLDSSASFMPLALELRDRFQIVAIDLWGHGQSGHRERSTSYPILDYVLLIEDIRRQLVCETFILLGHSLGAGVGCLYAGAFPERCDKVVFIEGLGTLSEGPDKAPARLRHHVEQILGLSQKRIPSYVDFAAASLIRERATGLSNSASLILAERGTKKSGDGVVWSADPRLKMDSQYYLTEEQICTFLASIRGPVLLISASNGFNFSGRVEFANRLKSIGQLTHEEIAGTHHVHMDSPGPVAKLISEFLLK